MKKTLKIYGIKGMVEKQMYVGSGGLRLAMTFKGGGATASRSLPATYKTSNPVYQAIIEGSDYYKKGYIKLVRQIPLGEGGGNSFSVRITQTGTKTAANGKTANKTGVVMVSAEQLDGIAEAVSKRMAAKGKTAKTEAASAEAETPDAVMEDPGIDPETETVDTVTTVKVSDIEGEGKNYLIKNFGLKSHDLRSKGQILAAAKRCSVEFVLPS
ncbi:MAG: hypothetical protein LUC33_07290 [Prevotellaceae bacterium]|nr:hypothetical protein [Prevotellaceae bacterium]